ncbi:MAG TPA: energy transducer TonB [Silvibacterium sp.]|jgi:TonB family protein|nr:energy transducer TonB [Silvibacterium sp.]
MICFRRSLVCLLLCLPLLSAAQSPKSVAHDLKGKTVLLRGKYVENDLAFDPQGNVTGTATPGPFSISAIKIEKVYASGTTLEIEGRRAVLINTGPSDPPQPADIRFIGASGVHIVINSDSAHPEALASLVKKVFAFSIDDALAGKTDAERRAELFTLAALPRSAKPTLVPDPSSIPTPSGEGATPAYKPGRGVSAPRVIYSVDPDFSDEARRKKVGGISVIRVIVDTNGFPIHLRMVKSLGSGLDENALAAVSQYRFAPAIYHDKPVAVLVSIEVNYRIY